MKKYISLGILLSLLLTTALVAVGLTVPSPREESSTALSKTNTEKQEAEPSSREPSMEDEPGASSEKEEVVYAILDFQGRPEEVYVVNSFTDESIVDYGRYSEVVNMTTREEIQVDGDQIRIHTEEERFFYQGTLEDPELPWNLSLSYFLDGEAITAEDLEGRSGSVEMVIDVTINEAVDPIFSRYYVMQIALMLDTDNFTDIQSPDGVFASAGRNRVINHTILPEEEASITVNAEARDFSMKEIEFSALPFSMVFEDPLEEELFDDFFILSDGVEGIYQGIHGLNSGLKEITQGARELNQGNREFGDGLEELSESSGPLLTSSRQIGDALETIAKELDEGADRIPDFEEIRPFIEALEILRDLLKTGEGQPAPWPLDFDDLQREFQSLREMIDEELAGLPDGEVDLDSLYEAVEGNDELTESLDRLNEYYRSSQRLREVYEATETRIEDMEEELEQIFGLYETILEELPGMIDQALDLVESGEGLGQIDDLISGMNELSENYEGFHRGLSQYMNGVRDLSKGQREIQSGYESLGEGLGDLGTGADELEAGAKELSDAVSLLPDTIQEEINRLMAEFDYSDFEPRSFVSEKNTEVSLVQFVFKTPEIGDSEVEEAVIEEPEPMNFWERLLALFGL